MWRGSSWVGSTEIQVCGVLAERSSCSHISCFVSWNILTKLSTYVQNANKIVSIWRFSDFGQDFSGIRTDLKFSWTRYPAFFNISVFCIRVFLKIKLTINRTDGPDIRPFCHLVSGLMSNSVEPDIRPFLTNPISRYGGPIVSGWISNSTGYEVSDRVLNSILYQAR